MKVTQYVLALLAVAFAATTASAFAPVNYDRLYAAIAQVESDDGLTSANVYQLTTRFKEDYKRITGVPFRKGGERDRAYSQRAMMTLWLYYGSRYEARTGKCVTAEVLAKMHRVGYVGLNTRRATASAYWKRVRKHYKEGGAK